MALFRRKPRHFLDLDPSVLGLEREGMFLFGPVRGETPRRRKVWGERCSGTNFLENLIRRNIAPLEAEGARLQWKHGLARLSFPDRALLNVFAVRDPIIWAQSLHKRPWHLRRRYWDRDFPAFIREEWVGVWHDYGQFPGERPGDRHPVERRRYRDIWEMRSVKLRHALVAAATLPNAVLVRYEDVAADPEGFVRGIGARFGLTVAEPFTAVNTYKGRTRKTFRRTEYAPLPPDDHAHVMSRLDPRLERFLGYLDQA